MGSMRILQEGPLDVGPTSISSDGIRVVVCENYVRLLRSLGTAFDAELTATLLEPLMVALSRTNKANLISALEEGIMAAVIEEQEQAEMNEDDVMNENDIMNEDDEMNEDDGMNEDDVRDDNSDDDDGDHPIFDCSIVGKRLFDLGSQAEVSVKARKSMYALSKTISSIF